MDVTPNPCRLVAHATGLGLRERKKLRTRNAIRRATYRLIAQEGYEATTVEQIAEAAEVSPSTVFRYFPVKEDIVLTDEYDPVMAEVLRSRPADEPMLESLRYVIIESLRNMLRDQPEELYARTRLMVDVPSVRARMTEAMTGTAQILADILAERTGRDPAELELRLFVSTVLCALREVTLYWGERDFQDDLFALVDRAVTLLRDLDLRQ
ncbi:TetR/AcrR family transcriptional regulator [Streptomyces montanisoli]|uniref:TetR family transcriptional regulator n=1 Tax=Streptomyces montanisoli TaxID=2798581 RepID=A0A940MH33_9ACTN|nr:TetR family transcriptional regulator [Streptomyces montanisoli]MBP0460738.1 TetR family transcriptional regulator [Streptomyces montanisoli]